MYIIYIVYKECITIIHSYSQCREESLRNCQSKKKTWRAKLRLTSDRRQIQGQSLNFVRTADDEYNLTILPLDLQLHSSLLLLPRERGMGCTQCIFSISNLFLFSKVILWGLFGHSVCLRCKSLNCIGNCAKLPLLVCATVNVGLLYLLRLTFCCRTLYISSKL